MRIKHSDPIESEQMINKFSSAYVHNVDHMFLTEAISNFFLKGATPNQESADFLRGLVGERIKKETDSINEKEKEIIKSNELVSQLNCVLDSIKFQMEATKNG
jgi:hypothetical protein